MSRPVEFIKGFLRDPAAVGSVWPSSDALTRRIVELGRAATARQAVELGPGTGAVTRALLGAMPAEGRLLAIERDEAFAELLARDFADARLEVVHGRSAEVLGGLAGGGGPPVDLVVSGIPFSTLPVAESRRTLEAIRGALAPGGRFVAYQVRGHVARLAAPYLGPPDVHVELRNLPPIRVYVWTRDRAD